MTESLLDIRLFVAAYEERSFTAAAQRENATQSGVSQHIRKLEHRFGVGLFAREKGRVSPTPAGDSYYRSCLEILRAYDSATKAVRAYAGGVEGQIVIGLMPTMTRCVLAPTLSRFTTAHPNTAVHIIEGYSAALTQMVQTGELDFAIVPTAVGVPGVSSHFYLRTPEVLVASRAHADRQNFAPVNTGELENLRLVVPSRAHARRQSIDTYFASNGVTIERMLELDAMLGTLDFIARSEWVAVLPGLMMAGEQEGDRFTINPLASPGLSLDLMLIEPARRKISDLASIFLDFLKEESERANARWSSLAAGPKAASR